MISKFRLLSFTFAFLLLGNTSAVYADAWTECFNKKSSSCFYGIGCDMWPSGSEQGVACANSCGEWAGRNCSFFVTNNTYKYYIYRGSYLRAKVVSGNPTRKR